MNITPTVSALELFVLLVGVAGVTISLMLIAVYQSDRGILKKQGLNGINKRLANRNLRNEIKRLLIQLGFIALAFRAMSVPPAEGTQGFWTNAVQGLLVSFQVLTILASLWDYVDRQRTNEDIAHLPVTVREPCADADCAYKGIIERLVQLAHDAELVAVATEIEAVEAIGIEPKEPPRADS